MANSSSSRSAAHKKMTATTSSSAALPALQPAKQRPPRCFYGVHVTFSDGSHEVWVPDADFVTGFGGTKQAAMAAATEHLRCDLRVWSRRLTCPSRPSPLCVATRKAAVMLKALRPRQATLKVVSHTMVVVKAARR